MKAILFGLVLVAKVFLASCQIPNGYVDGALCYRDCDSTGRLSCYFRFRIETSYTMSKACYNCPTNFTDCLRPDCIIGGGIQRTVQVANRQLPGPSIHVCEGDEVMVEVENLLESGESTSIHWHGQLMQRDPYMDGVPYVTQCPITYGNNFTYVFWADTPGTHFWHSHVKIQRGDGLFGAMIVRQRSQNNFHRSLYQFDRPEHLMVLTDWNRVPRMEVFQGYTKAGHWLEPTGILINGFGIQAGSNATNTPMANFNVESGNIYRFRMINANFFDCPFEVTIDKHPLYVISSDGEDVRPIRVDSISFSSGERFDFLIHANQPIDTYWVKVKGHLVCSRLGTFQLGVLTYGGSTKAIPSGPRPTYTTAENVTGVLLNPITRNNTTRRVITIDQLRSMRPVLPEFTSNNVSRFYLSFDMSGVDHPANHRANLYGFNQVHDDLKARTAQINHISFKPFDKPLLPNRFSYRSQDFCTHESKVGENCERNFCECPHVLEVNLNQVVELILFEEADQTDALAIHPVHLHGYGFRVVTWQEVGTNLTRAQVIENSQGYHRNIFNNPPIKDTVNVPRGGVTIIRFVANNPGYWLLHCHVDVHSTEGMEMVIKVGANELMAPIPHNFPQCGNYPDQTAQRANTMQPS